MLLNDKFIRTNEPIVPYTDHRQSTPLAMESSRVSKAYDKSGTPINVFHRKKQQVIHIYLYLLSFDVLLLLIIFLFCVCAVDW